MSMRNEIPILRLGESYSSMDVVELDVGERGTLVTHTANPGLIRRDLLQIGKAKAALDAIPAERLADYCEKAAELFLEGDLECGFLGGGGGDAPLRVVEMGAGVGQAGYKPVLHIYNHRRIMWRGCRR